MHLLGPHRWLLNAAITFVSSFFSSILFSFLKVSCSITDSFFSLMTESFTHADLNTSLNVFGWCNLRWVDIYLIRWWIYLALPLHQFLLPTQVFLVLSHIFLVTNFPAAIINDFFSSTRFRVGYILPSILYWLCQRQFFFRQAIGKIPSLIYSWLKA